MVKTCVGTEFCRFGVQDSTSAGIELERRLENLFTPAQSEDGRGRLPAQLRRGDGEGHRHGGPGRKLASGGGRRGRQIRAQGRPADHRRDHGRRRWKRASCSSSITARTPTIWSAPTISWSGWESKEIRKETVYAPEAEKAEAAGPAAAIEGDWPRTRGWSAKRRFIPRSSCKSNLWRTQRDEQPNTTGPASRERKTFLRWRDGP